MSRVAAGLLVVMAGLLIAAHHWGRATGGWTGEVWAALGAFAEAGLVGGLADWFAVTALFRHPLGLPIPHTAIIPANQDRIADSLAAFLRRHFLTPPVVARRLAAWDLAGAAGTWLARPADPSGTGRVTSGAAALLADALAALDRERFGGFARTALAGQLARLDVAGMLGRALGALIAEDRHLPLIEALLGAAGSQLEANEDLVRAMIRERANGLVRFIRLDAPLADAIIDGLYKLLAETLVHPDHPLRQEVNAALGRLAHDLVNDPTMRARVERAWAAALANPAMGQWLDGVWERARRQAIAGLRQPASADTGLAPLLSEFGAALRHDPRLNRLANRFARRVACGFAQRQGGPIVALVSDTIRRWDARTVTTRIEAAVGRDLQFIRINGTLVGGLVGLALHALGRLV